jgi:hypothetical protein
MQTPNNIAGDATEMIMAKIKQHIIRELPPQENHHYNRVYEAIYKILSENNGFRLES